MDQGADALPPRRLTVVMRGRAGSYETIFVSRRDRPIGANGRQGNAARVAVPIKNSLLRARAGLAIDALGHPWIGGQIFAAAEFAQPGQPTKVLSPAFTGPLAANSNDGFVARFDRANGLLR